MLWINMQIPTFYTRGELIKNKACVLSLPSCFSALFSVKSPVFKLKKKKSHFATRFASSRLLRLAKLGD